jgi:DNA-binding GntR family transcriptional regulator
MMERVRKGQQDEPRQTDAIMAPIASNSSLLEITALAPETSRSQHTTAPKSRAVIAYDCMRGLILTNKWAPGFQITEQEAATLLEMSRTPVREAMLQLQQEGLAAVKPRHGLKVLPISPEDMSEIYVILTSLESTAAELAAGRRLEDADLQPMVNASEEMVAALKANDLDQWAEADARFHLALLDLADNKKLTAIVLNFMDRVHRARRLTLHLRPTPHASTDEHQALVDAIRSGDAVAAGKIHRAHRERAKQEMLAILKRLGLHQV